MKYLAIILASIAFTILLITLYPFRQKYNYPGALPTPTPTRPVSPTDIPWQTYRNNEYGFSLQYPEGGFDPKVTVDQTSLSYLEIIKTMKPIESSETTLSINNTKYNLFKAKFGDFGEFSYVYFSHLRHNYLITFGGFPIEDITKILSSFIFFTPSSKYSCPKVEYIDCMPGPGVAKPQCESSYLQWAQVNCPNFKGAAL